MCGLGLEGSGFGLGLEGLGLGLEGPGLVNIPGSYSLELEARNVGYSTIRNIIKGKR